MADRKFLLNFETFGIIGALVVSMAALFIAWDQAMVMRQQQHASAWPFALVAANYDNSGENNTIELVMSNPGVGPARMRSAHFLAGDNRVATWQELAEQTLPPELQATVIFEQMGSALGVLGVGEERTILRMTWPHTGSIDRAFLDYMSAAISGIAPAPGLDVCYCSVYGRCWHGTSDLDRMFQDHEVVGSCETAPDFLATSFNSPDEFDLEGRSREAGFEK